MVNPDSKSFLTEERAGILVSPRFMIGLIIFGLGVIFLLDRMHILESHASLRMLPLIPIAIGLVKMIYPGPRAARIAGAIWVLVGFLLLGWMLHLYRINFELLWPLVMVTFGAYIVYRSFARTVPAPASSATQDATESLSLFSMMAGIERKSSSKSFRGGDVTAVMGGCDIDLRDAVPIPDGAVIDVFALWGGVELSVPGDWTVSIEATPIMGGIEDSRKTVGSDPAKRLTLKGIVLMGGVEIHN